MLIKASLAILIFAVQLGARDRAWQTGTLLDEAKASSYIGTLSASSVSAQGSATKYRNSSVAQASAAGVGASVPLYRTDEILVIDTPRYSFVLGRRVWFRQAALTVNGPIKFAVEGADVYVWDEADREFQDKPDQEGPKTDARRVKLEIGQWLGALLR